MQSMAYLDGETGNFYRARLPSEFTWVSMLGAIIYIHKVADNQCMLETLR